jgi:hypothetical protein
VPSWRIVMGDRINGAGVGYEARSGVGVGDRKGPERDMT